MKALQSSTCCLTCTRALAMGNRCQPLISSCSVLMRPPTASFTSTPTLLCQSGSTSHLILMEVTSFSRSVVSVKRRQSSRCCRCSRKQQYLVVSQTFFFIFTMSQRLLLTMDQIPFLLLKKPVIGYCQPMVDCQKKCNYHPAPIKTVFPF